LADMKVDGREIGSNESVERNRKNVRGLRNREWFELIPSGSGPPMGNMGLHGTEMESQSKPVKMWQFSVHESSQNVFRGWSNSQLHQRYSFGAFEQIGTQIRFRKSWNQNIRPSWSLILDGKVIRTRIAESLEFTEGVDFFSNKLSPTN
jgi:hypothetical protein